MVYRILKAKSMEELLSKFSSLNEKLEKKNPISGLVVLGIVHVPSRRKTDYQAMVEYH